jgi:TPR repeat protein
MKKVLGFITIGLQLIGCSSGFLRTNKSQLDDRERRVVSVYETGKNNKSKSEQAVENAAADIASLKANTTAPKIPVDLNNAYDHRVDWDHDKYLLLSSKNRPALQEIDQQDPTAACGEDPDLARAQLNMGKAYEPFAQVLEAAENGDPHAFVRLADMYVLGEGTQPNLMRAVYWHTKAAAKGMVASQIALGNMYRDGMGVNKDNSSALSWYKKAAEAGSIQAMLLMGQMYEGWYLSKVDLDKSEYWFTHAACLGSQDAQMHLAGLDDYNHSGINDDNANNQRTSPANNNGDDFNSEHGCIVSPEIRKKEVEQMLKDADAGKKDAKFKLAEHFAQGKGGSQDLNKALKYYKEAASSNSPEAAYKLGMMLLNGDKVQRDPNAALYWLAKAANAGYPGAQYQLGYMYHYALGVPRNLKIAKDWYIKSSAQGHPSAAARIGDMYHAGEGVPRYTETAAHWYDVAANRENTYAKYMLSIMYELGRGVAQDICKSVNYYESAKTYKDSMLALSQIAKNFEKGYGLPRDVNKAVRWYKYSAALKFAPAKTALGDIFTATHEQLAKDYSQANAWYMDAAEQGYPYAEYCLGIAYLQGRGMAKDIHEAAAWFKRAAEKGNRPAQFELGLLYFNGDGLKRNDVRAYGWWSISLRENNELTPDNMMFLIDRMEPDLRQKALVLSSRYRERYGHDDKREIY